MHLYIPELLPFFPSPFNLNFLTFLASGSLVRDGLTVNAEEGGDAIYSSRLSGYRFRLVS